MGGTQDAPIPMYQIDQRRHRHPPQLQQANLYAFGHDYQNVPGVPRVILDALKYHEVRMSLSLYMFFPIAVSIIRVMIGDDHSLEALAL